MPGEIPPLPLAMASQITSTSALLRTIANWDEESQDIYQVVATAFKVGAVYLYCIKDLQAIGITPKSYINSLDKVLCTQSQANELSFEHLVTDNRQLSRRFRSTKTVHTSIKEGLWNLRNPPRFVHNYARAQKNQ